MANGPYPEVKFALNFMSLVYLSFERNLLLRKFCFSFHDFSLENKRFHLVLALAIVNSCLESMLEQPTLTLRLLK